MISVRDKEHSFPFVKEVLVASLTRAGMKPWQAHTFAKEIEDELLVKETGEIKKEDLANLVYERLKDVNEKAAERYRAWRSIKKGEKEPIIILIGGGTGVGTTTVGTEVAHRLGIKNILATDSIREVMRKSISARLLPVLHASSYDAYKCMNVALSEGKEDVLTGFRLQVSQVAVGVEAIIERALKEGTPTMVEGLHIVPGFISEELVRKPNVIMFVLHVKDEKEHKNHLYSRAFETKFKRSVERYMENFKGIREIQKYIIREAERKKVPIIENTDVEKSVVQIMDSVINEIAKQTKKEESD